MRPPSITFASFVPLRSAGHTPLLTSGRRRISVRSIYHITGCEFSVAQELLVLAKGEGNSGIREWCGRKYAEDSVAQHGTRCRWSQGFLALVLWLHYPCTERLSLPTSRS